MLNAQLDLTRNSRLLCFIFTLRIISEFDTATTTRQGMPLFLHEAGGPKPVRSARRQGSSNASAATSYHATFSYSAHRPVARRSDPPRRGSAIPKGRSTFPRSQTVRH